MRQPLVLAGVLVVLSAAHWAQVHHGQVSGAVTDPTGAIIPRATVLLRNLETSAEWRTLTDTLGTYSFPQVPAGRYHLQVAAPGFGPATVTDLQVHTGTARHVDVGLGVTAMQEVSVNSAPPVVNIEHGRLSTVIDAAHVNHLPLNGRNVYDLLQQAPGAVSTQSVIYESGAGAAVNGVRVNFNGFYVNGASARRLSGGYNQIPIQDAVLEFQILTLNNSAEFGSSAGAITNLVTKSGTNQWHGSAFWSGRNNALDAVPFFLKKTGSKNPPLRLHQFGGTVGGPLQRNRLFIFAAYQNQRFLTATTGAPVLAETEAFRRAIQAALPNSVAALLYRDFAPRTDSTPSLTLDQYVRGPDGQFGGASFSGGGFSRFSDYLCTQRVGAALAERFAGLLGVTAQDQADLSAAGCSMLAQRPGLLPRDIPFLDHTAVVYSTRVANNLQHGQQAFTRLDWNASSKTRINASAGWTESQDEFSGTVSGFSTDIVSTSIRGFRTPSYFAAPSAEVSVAYFPTARLLNQAQFAYFGAYSTVAASHPGVPGILFLDGSLGFGSLSGFPRSFREHVFSFADHLTLNLDRRIWKFGVELRRNLENSDFNIGRPTYLFFDPLFFAADAPFFQTAGVEPSLDSNAPSRLATNIRRWRNWELGLYASTDWRVSRRLTLNLGLRYDLFTPHREAADLATGFLLGPGSAIIEDVATGAGKLKSASVPMGTPGCSSPQQIARAQLAGICGPGGFAATDILGKYDRNNFSPRIGAAWDVFGAARVVLRSGFGVSYQNTLYDMMSFSRYNLPHYSLNQVNNFLVRDSGTVLYGPQVPGAAPSYTGVPPASHNAGTGVQATGNIVGWDPRNPNLASASGIVPEEGLRDPYVLNWFTGVQFSVGPAALEFNYVGTAGRKLYRSEDINRVAGGRLPPGVCVTDEAGRRLCSQLDFSLTATGRPLNPTGRVNPNFGTLRVWSNSASSSYHGLQSSVRGRFRTVHLNASYTWSHAIDTGSTWFSSFTTANGTAAGDSYTTDNTRPSLDRGNSLFDVRHRLSASYVWYPRPFATGLMAALTGGWELGGIVSAQSGSHWSAFDPRPRFLSPLAPGACSSATFSSAGCVNIGGDYNLDGVANDRPNMAAPLRLGFNQWAGGAALPSGFFTAPCLGCASHVARNSLVGPDYWAWDASVARVFAVSDALSLKLRLDAFNLLNRTNFQLPGNAGHNRINDPLFGQAGGTFNPRQLQIGVKLSF